MKIKCENVVICGNYDCAMNFDGKCPRTVIALGSDGRCTMYRTKYKIAPTNVGFNVQTKPTKPFDMETSE